MRLIDADYLVNNILEWQKALPDDQKQLLTKVIHCINAKDTVFDVQKLINSVYDEKLDLEYVDEKDVKDAVLYNGAISDVIEDIKLAVNPFHVGEYIWDERGLNESIEEYHQYCINHKNGDESQEVNFE